MSGQERPETVDPLASSGGPDHLGSGRACPVRFPQEDWRTRQKRIHTLFHLLWSKAVSAEGYEKREWQELQDLLRIEEMGARGRGS